MLFSGNGGVVCKDYANNCEEALRMQYCVTPYYIPLMRQRCNLTCGLCGGKAPYDDQFTVHYAL